MIMKKTQCVIYSLLVVVVITLFFTGCNTLGGMGEDIESGGRKIQDAAGTNSDY